MQELSDQHDRRASTVHDNGQASAHIHTKHATMHPHEHRYNLQTRQQQQQQMYAAAACARWLKAINDVLSRNEPYQLEREGPQRFKRYADRRSRGLHADELCGRGGRKASHDALNTIAYSICGRCSSLVDISMARKAARADRREIFKLGDGCAGYGCAARFQKSRFAERQRAAADRLRRQEAHLAAWPHRVDGGRDGSSRHIMYVFDRSQANDVGACVLARMGPGPRAARR